MINPLLKLALGFGLMVVLWLVFPILDIFDIFLQLVAVPLVFIACFAVGMDGAYEGFRVAYASGFFGDLRGRLTTYREMMGSQPQEQKAA